MCLSEDILPGKNNNRNGDSPSSIAEDDGLGKCGPRSEWKKKIVEIQPVIELSKGQAASYTFVYPTSVWKTKLMEQQLKNDGNIDIKKDHDRTTGKGNLSSAKESEDISNQNRNDKRSMENEEDPKESNCPMPKEEVSVSGSEEARSEKEIIPKNGCEERQMSDPLSSKKPKGEVKFDLSNVGEKKDGKASEDILRRIQEREEYKYIQKATVAGTVTAAGLAIGGPIGVFGGIGAAILVATAMTQFDDDEDPENEYPQIKEVETASNGSLDKICSKFIESCTCYR